MSNVENAPRDDERLAMTGEEWDMTPPEDVSEGGEVTDLPANSTERNKWSKCGLSNPGEELGWRERSTMKFIAQAYKEEVRGDSPKMGSLHDRVIDAFGRFLEVPGYGSSDEDGPTEAQRARLEELYQKVVEEEEATRSIFDKIRYSKQTRDAFKEVLATAAAIGLAIGLSMSSQKGVEDTAGTLIEVENAMKEEPEVAAQYENEYGITISDLDDLIRG